MNQNFNSFFENPTLLGLIAILLLVASPIVTAYLNSRNAKKTRSDNKDRGTDIVSALDKNTATLKILLDKEKNSLNKQSAAELIEATMRQAENYIKSEVLRVFQHNHRNEPKRQAVIKNAITAATEIVYDSCITSLKELYYKEKSLAEFMTSFETEELKIGLLEHIFDKNESDMQDLGDTMFFTETFFNSVITNAKSYYSNL